MKDHSVDEHETGGSCDQWPPSEVTCYVEDASRSNLLLVTVYGPPIAPGLPRRKFQGALIDVNNGKHVFSNPPDFRARLLNRASKAKVNSMDKDKENFPVTQPTTPLGVQLRARQVLCSKCKNLCSENGESIQKSDDIRSGPAEDDDSFALPKKKGSLVPRIRKLNPNEIKKLSTVSEVNQDCAVKQDSPSAVVEGQEVKPLKIRLSSLSSNETKRVSKKRSRDQVDLNSDSDDNVFESKTGRATLLKISFGNNGDETVVKIPHLSTSDENNPAYSKTEPSSGIVDTVPNCRRRLSLPLVPDSHRKGSSSPRSSYQIGQQSSSTSFKCMLTLNKIPKKDPDHAKKTRHKKKIPNL